MRLTAYDLLANVSAKAEKLINQKRIALKYASPELIKILAGV